MEPLLLPYASCQSPVSPLAALFQNFSLTLWVTQYFLGTGRKVNSFAAILLVSSSQLPFLGSWSNFDFCQVNAGLSFVRRIVAYP